MRYKNVKQTKLSCKGQDHKIFTGKFWAPYRVSGQLLPGARCIVQLCLGQLPSFETFGTFLVSLSIWECLGSQAKVKNSGRLKTPGSGKNELILPCNSRRHIGDHLNLHYMKRLSKNLAQLTILCCYLKKICCQGGGGRRDKHIWHVYCVQWGFLVYSNVSARTREGRTHFPRCITQWSETPMINQTLAHVSNFHALYLRQVSSRKPWSWI